MSKNNPARDPIKHVVMGAVVILIGGWLVWTTTTKRSEDCHETAPLIVSKLTMLRCYRDYPALADKTYTGKRIRLVLDSGEYRHSPDLPPVIVCEPAYTLAEIRTVTTGVCLGIYPCEEDRGDGCRFFIKLECCEHK